MDGLILAVYLVPYTLAVGWLVYVVWGQKKEIHDARTERQAVAGTLHAIVEALNQAPVGAPKVVADARLPRPSYEPAPPGVEPLVLTRAVPWREWGADEEEATR